MLLIIRKYPELIVENVRISIRIVKMKSELAKFLISILYNKDFIFTGSRSLSLTIDKNITQTLKFIIIMTALNTGTASATSYIGGTITFNNTMPTGVLIYFCEANSKCSRQQQLDRSGYMTPIPIEQIPTSGKPPLQPAPQAFLYKTGSYVLWQLNSKKTAWNSCMLNINANSPPNGNCPGLSWVNRDFKDPVVSVNLYNSNGHIMPDGTTYLKNGLKFPPNPRMSQPAFPPRKFVVNYTGSHAAICLNILGNFNTSSACDGRNPGDVILKKGVAYNFVYGKTQNICDPKIKHCAKNGPYTVSQVFVVSGIQLENGKPFIPTGQQAGTISGSKKGYTAYGARYEFTFFPQALSNNLPSFNGGTLSTGVSTIDMSVVNGYNFGFNLYPQEPTICALAQQESGPSHYAIWSSTNPMANFSGKLKYCPIGHSVVTKVQNKNLAAGCQSDGTFATNTKSPWADAYNCNGNYQANTKCAPPASDPQPFGYKAASIPSGAPKPWRPYSQNLGIGLKDNGKDILLNTYTWAYQDFRGTFTCDGNVQSYMLEISDVQ